MSIKEAKKYIVDLHKKQDDPFLWPDFLTGLPGKDAIIKKLESVYSRTGTSSVAYVKIANVQPYLIKYGPNKHAEIIQWAAAVLSTGFSKCSSSFVGTLSTHEFIVVCDSDIMMKQLKEAGKYFRQKTEMFYSAEDLKRGTALSFKSNDGKKVSRGLMRLVSVVADRKSGVKREHIVQEMGRLCETVEDGTEEIVLMTDPKKC